MTDATTAATQRGTLRTLLSYAAPYRRSLGLSLVLTLASSAAGLLQPLVARTVLDELTANRPTAGWVVLLVGLFLVAAVLGGLKTWMQQRSSEQMVRGIRRGLIYRMIRLHVSTLDRHPPADITARITSDCTLLQRAATEGTIMIVNGVLTVLTAIALMATLDLTLTAVTVTVLVMIYVVMSLVLPRIRIHVAHAQTSVGEIAATLDRALGAARTVKANGAEERESARAYRATDDAYQAGLSGAKFGAVADTLSGSAVQLAFLIILGVGGSLVAADSLALSTLIAFLLYVFYLFGPIMSLTNGSALVAQGLGGMTRIEQTMTMDIETDLDDRGPPSRNEVSGAPEIDVRALTFAYPERSPTLCDISFRVPGGSRTALVGLSGAGKTTLFSLLQRFYEPQSGTITVDGLDIHALPRSEVRRRIAYVEQDAPMLEGSIRENVIYGAPGSGEDEIRRVLQLTRMDDVVDRLPQGLDTPVGPRGITLSGGERQRLAIARALLRRPMVLLLDEATAQLDGRNEGALRDAVSEAARFCTVVIIAHRLATVTDVDQIVVLESGGVRAAGTHDFLLATDDLYRELATTQMLMAR